MKNIIIIFIAIIYFSCNNQEKSPKYILYPDSTNYEYTTLKNGLQKVVRFFPNTKDTSVIYFVNHKNKRQDSTAHYFYKNGNIHFIIKHESELNTLKYEFFYKNGILKKESTTVNSHTVGNVKSYYKTGKLRSIIEVVLYNDSMEYNNNMRIYKQSGELNMDSTCFVEMISNKDTISLNDSLKIEFNIISKNAMYVAYFGSINEHIKSTNYNNVEFIINNETYYKPKHLGVNYIRIVFEIPIFPDKKNSPFRKIFLVKEVYVIK